MTDYYWVPVADSTIDDWAVGRAVVKRCSVLPRNAGQNNYPPNTDKRGQWADIHTNDTIYICCHGRKRSLSEVAWENGGETTKWNAFVLAIAYINNLASAGGANHLNLDLHLTACWGANQFTPLITSFGEKLADVLHEAKCKGTLTAYQGATLLNKHGDYQKGSSRFTTGLLYWKELQTTDLKKMSNKSACYQPLFVHKTVSALKIWDLESGRSYSPPSCRYCL